MYLFFADSENHLRSTPTREENPQFHIESPPVNDCDITQASMNSNSTTPGYRMVSSNRKRRHLASVDPPNNGMFIERRNNTMVFMDVPFRNNSK